MPNHTPLVSVLIPAHNREAYIAQSVASALAQTVADLEVIVVDDGSSDATPDILARIADPRLRVIRHETNHGIPAGRNSALEAARGRFIAWLDSDDIARPRRLEIQLRALAARPELAFVGACAVECDSAGRRRGGVRVPPQRAGDVRAWLLFRSAFQQSSITGRAEILKRYPYREEMPVCEDYDACSRISEDHPILNLAHVLIERRIHPERTMDRQQTLLKEKTKILQAAQLARLGLAPTEDELERHFLLPNLKPFSYNPDRAYLDWLEGWLGRLNAANRTAGYCPPESLGLVTSLFWAYACRQSYPSLPYPRRTYRLFASPAVRPVFSRGGVNWLRVHIVTEARELATLRLPGTRAGPSRSAFIERA